eukprot:5104357-Pleurochrysis_carterae.AAC.1
MCFSGRTRPSVRSCAAVGLPCRYRRVASPCVTTAWSRVWGVRTDSSHLKLIKCTVMQSHEQLHDANDDTTDNDR